MAVQMQKIWQQRGSGQIQEKLQKSDRGSVAGIGRSDRGFEGNRRGQFAGFWPTEAVGPRLRKEKTRLGRSEGAQRCVRDT